MATATDIHIWFQGPRDYRVGIALLKELGEADEADMFLLELGETAVSRRTLESSLAAVLDEHVRAERERKVVVQEVVTKQDILEERRAAARSPHTDGYEDEHLPPALRDVRASVKEALKEMGYLRSRLELLATDADRYRDALRIVELDEQIASAYSRLDAWRATGRDPGEAQDVQPPQAAGDLAKELRNIITYISRVNSGKRKASPEQVALWRKRKEELEEALNAM